VRADPSSNRGWIDTPQSLRAQWACHGPSVAVEHPRCVKAEPRSVRGANPFKRDDTEYQRASRQTISINDDELTR